MDDSFAIAGNGFAGTIVRPSAFILAIAGGMIVPGAQVEAGMQPKAIQGAGVTASFASGAFLADIQPDPDVLTLADVMRPTAAAAVAFAGPGLAPEPASASAGHDLRLVGSHSGGLTIADRNAETLSFSTAVNVETAGASSHQRFADAFSADGIPAGAGDGDPGLVAQPAPAPSAGELSGKATSGVLELVAFDPFAAKSQPGSDIADHLTRAPATQVEAIAFVSNPVVQPLPDRDMAARPEVSAVLAKTALAGTPPRDSASPRPMAAAPAKAAMPALVAKAPTPKTKTTQAAPARSPLSAALVTPRPHTTPKVVSGRTMPGYRLSGDVIEFTLSTSVNGQPAAAIPLRVTRDDRLWLRTGDLLSLVKAMMPQDQFDRLAASSAMEDYITFDKVRGAGISLRYDVARNLIAIGSD